MSELRRNRGPDDGDKPADKPSEADTPTRRPSMELRTSDQVEGREVDRRRLTPIQRDFIRTEKEAAESGVPRKPITTYSMDWASGEHVDGWYDPPERDSPYAEPPADFHRDNSELEARTLERTDAAPAEDYGEIVKRGSPERRRKTEFLKSGEELTKDAGKGAQTVHDLMTYRPPSGHAETRVPKDPNVLSDHAPPPSVADVAASAVAAGLVLGAASHRIYETIKERKERRAGNE